MTRRRDIMRWGGALTALVYLFGWMIGFAHNVTEQHVVCAEHGDLVHAGHGHAEAEGDHDHDGHDGHDHASMMELADSGDVLPSLDAVPGHDDHEHCSIGPFLRDDDDFVVNDTAVPPTAKNVVYVDEPRAYAEAIRPPPVSILALAPKTSPPRHT